jgi:hypothetical protein
MFRTISKAGCASLWAAGWLFTATLAHAADAAAKEDADKAASDGDADDKEAAPAKEGEGAPAEGAAASETAAQADATSDAAAGNSPAELPGKTYRFVGARYRGIIAPKFMQNLFASGGRTVYVHAFGPEFAIRKDGFEYNLSAWLGLYNMGDTAFKGSSDPETAWEIINAKMQILYLTSDFLWSHEFTPEFALNYGVGAGFGFVFGNLYRNQSYPTVPGQDPNSYSKCAGPGSPAVAGPYCDGPSHYGESEPGWASGGSKPLLFPWLALQTGIRFKPAKSFAGRLDLGFGTSGFFFGLGGDYGL